ncbi:ArnT family glycosyltransferase [Patescibacteria group bacterium]
MRKNKILELIFILIVFSLAFFLRTYRIDNPVADWHSWRQADTAAVARNFSKEGINLLYPKAHNFFKQNPNDLDNPNRYFLNEFPLYNAVVAVIYNLFGINEVYARLVSVFFSSLTAVFLYLLVKKYSSKLVAGLSAVFFAVLPYNIFYGRVIMPDPTFIFFSVLSLYFVTLWLEKEKWSLAIISALSLGLAMLVKPYAIFLGIPIAYLVLRKYKLDFYKKPQIILVAVLSLIMIGLWRFHINQHPEGMFGSQWLINATNIRFKGSFFRWIVFDRMNRLIFATGGFVLFWLGLVAKKSKKEGWFYLSWLLSVAIYISYFAMGNVTHDYYQMPIVPIGCIMMAKGFEFLVKRKDDFISRIINLGVALSLVLLMLAFGWYEVRGFFNINRWEIVEAGKAVDTLTPKDSKVIAPYDRDPAFLYQTNRNGWSGLRNIDELKEYIDQGATHLVSVNFDKMTEDLKSNCSVLKETDKFVIIELQTCKLDKLFGQL